MKEMICPRCGAQLPYSPGDTHIQCLYCGTEFVLNPQRRSLGRAVIYQGVEIFRVNLPDSWNISTFPDYDNVSSAAALSIGTRLQRGAAAITIHPVGYFKDSRPEGMDPITLMNRRKLRSLSEYAAWMIQRSCKGCKLLNLTVMPHSLEQISPLLANMAAPVLGETEQDMGKFSFQIAHGGQQLAGYFATVRVFKKGTMSQLETDSHPQQKPEPAKHGFQMPRMTFDQLMRGGLIGMKMRGDIPNTREPSSGDKKSGWGAMGEKLRSFSNPYDWGKYYDVLMTVPSGENAPEYEKIFDAVCTSFAYTPQYFQMQQQEAAAAQNIMVQGAMQRQQTQIQASQRLSATLQQRSNTVMQGWENRRAAQDRMQRNFSEAVRGVNSYTDTSGNKVEASVRYDHVYQNGSYFAGSDAPVDLGVDWVELKKND